MATSDQTPSDLDTSDTSGDSQATPFDDFTGNVLTLAGGAEKFVKALNSPTPNNTPSNVPSTAPTPPPSQTSMFAGWTTTQKVLAGIAAGVGLILGFLGLKKLLE